LLLAWLPVAQNFDFITSEASVAVPFVVHTSSPPHFCSAVLVLGREGGAPLLEPGQRHVTFPLLQFDSLSRPISPKWLQAQVATWLKQFAHPDVDISFDHRHLGGGRQTDRCSCGAFAALYAARAVAALHELEAHTLGEVVKAAEQAIAHIHQDYIVDARSTLR
jgi:hypothetical protein